MERVRAAAVVAAVVALLVSPSGCARPPPTAAPTVVPSASAAVEPLVRYARDSGASGEQVELTVRGDGGYEIVRSGAPSRGTLPAGEVAELRGVLERSGFADIPSVNSIAGDGPTHAVTYAGHAVLADDGAQPDALRPVLAALDRLLVRHG
jgi:hypothetical protein